MLYSPIQSTNLLPDLAGMSPFSINGNNTATKKRKLDDFTGVDQTVVQLNDLSSRIFDFCKRKKHLVSSFSVSKQIKSVLTDFVSITPNDFDRASEHLKKFISCCVLEALIMLYMAQSYRIIAYKRIREFINSLKSESLRPIYAYILLEFCNILGEEVETDDDLYNYCRRRLGAMIKSVGISRCKDDTKNLVSLSDVFPFVIEITARLYDDLDSNVGSSKFSGLSFILMHDLIAFIRPVWNVLLLQVPLMDDDTGEAEYDGEIVLRLHGIFYVLLEKMEVSLRLLGSKKEGKDVQDVPWWSLYLVILKELSNISKLYTDLENAFWQTMRQVKASLCILIVSSATESGDYGWLFEHKEVTNFEVREHLAMMMLPEVEEDDEEDQYDMLIDRYELLEDSFDLIGIIAKPEHLRGSLFVEFKNEEATGPGVLREWFLLVCREIFKPQTALFVACPNERRRFFPNQASKVNPSHLEYFLFSGRMIAPALMHNVQIGVVFDRTFFLQLSGKDISLEDVKDADPFLYNGCKQILDMDAETVDQDVLGLTFFYEVESLGSRNKIELCPNGKDIVVDSKNRETYVNLLIQHRIVTSIAEQVEYFSKGFADLITTSRVQSFFRCLNLEDLDLMLDGSGNDVSVEDWKAHTDYHGYKQSDPEISWFWEIVGHMSVEQRKVLLFFWTSIKSLPVQGFGGLDSRLCIYESSQSDDHLPSSQTCFNRICLSCYQIYKERSSSPSIFSMHCQFHSFFSYFRLLIVFLAFLFLISIIFRGTI